MKLIGYLVPALLAAGVAWPPVAAVASTAGQTRQGWPYMSGGVSDDERTAMLNSREAFSLWIITAATVSGVYLADVHISIRDSRNLLVFDQTLDGPWLFVDMPAGRYELEATWHGQSIHQTTTLRFGDHHQMVTHFKLPDYIDTALGAGESSRR